MTATDLYTACVGSGATVVAIVGGLTASQLITLRAQESGRSRRLRESVRRLDECAADVTQAGDDYFVACLLESIGREAVLRALITDASDPVIDQHGIVLRHPSVEVIDVSRRQVITGSAQRTLSRIRDNFPVVSSTALTESESFGHAKQDIVKLAAEWRDEPASLARTARSREENVVQAFRNFDLKRDAFRQATLNHENALTTSSVNLQRTIGPQVLAIVALIILMIVPSLLLLTPSDGPSPTATDAKIALALHLAGFATFVVLLVFEVLRKPAGDTDDGEAR